MMKRILTAMVIVLMATSVCLAKGHILSGKVQTVSGTELVIKNSKGKEYHFVVLPTTEFKGADGKVVAVDTVAKDVMVRVKYAKSAASDKYEAHTVILSK